jgi:diguanylate cyclase (GGDEF)-like protein
MATIHIAAVLAALVVAALTWHEDHWRIPQLLLIVLLTAVGDYLSADAGARFQVSGASVGIMLAVVLLGPGPALVAGLVAVLAGYARTREDVSMLLCNVAAFAWFPLAGALAFHAAVSGLAPQSSDLGFYLLVFAVSVGMLVLNFVIIASFLARRHRTSLLRQIEEALLPLLSAHLFASVLEMLAIYAAVQAGSLAILLVGLVIAIFQYLVAELLKSKARGKELQRLATLDTLTGLANRDRFQEAVAAALADQTDLRRPFAVMLIDLDRFKEVNDTLGHHYGDELLRKLGPRLEAAIGPDGLVARLGGDEFALLTPPATDEETFELAAARLIACVAQPIYVDELALEVGASIGIARFPVDGTDANTLLRRADVAMYAAKEAHSGWTYYAPELDRNSVRKLSVISDFRRALEDGEIVAYYQPIVDVVGGRVRGAEALVRWEHPELGVLAPGSFVDTVEQTGLIGPMTRTVLEQAVAQCAQWREDGHDLSIAVNLSVRNLLDHNLPWEIDRLLTHHGLPPEALHLEITESMLMSDPERARGTVTRLNALGIRLSVDDFGTGYSSLAYLRQMPIDELKIDRSFVSPMLRDESDLIIVRSTINLGHDLGLRVIAEGVEDEATLGRLARLGCDLAQGYHISRPMPALQFVRWLDQDAAPEDVAVAV